MSVIRRFVLGAAATVFVLAGMAFAPVYAVSDNKIGDNVVANSGVGFVLMTSIRRNR